ncbi:hypothetical protein [Nocardioides humi]|uniref:Uncharacterized protein n=1 Tax=Nocardioides humi TaxID=449461 RepID=A0ABN2AVA7_9ACTN|nr:hypothetical protein [Nocardioides humi]
MTEYDDVPPLLPPDRMPPITDQAALEHTWRALTGRLGFDEPQLWTLFVDGVRPLHLAQVRGVPLVPVADDLDRLQVLVRHARQHDLACAFLYARPGRRARTPGDLAWARGLAGLDGRWPVHLANDAELRVAAPDDLVDAGWAGAA